MLYVLKFKQGMADEIEMANIVKIQKTEKRQKRKVIDLFFVFLVFYSLSTLCDLFKGETYSVLYETTQY